MKKRLLAFLSMLVLLTCAMTVAVSADTPSNRYQVGYAIRDVNPYIYSESLGFGVRELGELANDPEWTVEVEVQHPDTNTTTTERMICVPLSGYANSSERPSGGIIDDTGDGYTGIGDGLHITCTTVTDAEGVTLVYFTVDAISGYANLLSDAAAGAVARLGNTLHTERVFLNGSHSHEGADFGTVKKTINAQSSNRDRLWRAYYDYTVQQMVDAAVECYENRTEAIMTKGTVDASDATGYQLNYVRQYKVEEYSGYGNGQYSWIPATTYFFGANFGRSAKPEETPYLRRTVNNVSQADDNMHILQFTPTNGDKPIILVNWRCHATMMSGATGGGTGAIISADYIAAFRHEMQKKGYRFAFLQGAAGNIVASHTLSGKVEGACPWEDEKPADALRAVYYGGKMLTAVATECLENHMTDELTPGPIRSIRQKLDLDAQVDPPGLVAACKYYQSAGLTSSNYKYTWPVEEGGDGKVYIINSKHHARNVVSRSNGNVDTYADLTVNAFVLGESVAFVTAPTEMFDRYSLTATFSNTQDNDWDDLIDENTYGIPFVMAYTNGHNGYTANKLSYSFNSGSAKFGVGSYEANSSRNAAGEGEKIIVGYKKMLGVITDGYKTAYCEHCREDAVWTPLLAGQLSSSYTLKTGHYYVYEDVPLPSARNYCSIAGDKVCLDLNGKTLQTACRAFSISSRGVLSIMDSVGGGVVESYDAPNSVGGGVVSTSGNAVINLYGGTLRMVTGEDAYVTKGGVISLNNATGNIYGGIVDASQCTLVKDRNNNVVGNTDGCGAAIAVYGNGVLTVSGGQIIAGNAEPEEGRGNCIFVQSSSSKVTLSGEAKVDELYFDAACPTNFKVDGNYAGTASVRFNPNIRIYDGVDVGNLTGMGEAENATIACANSGCQVVAQEGELILRTDVAAVGDSSFTSLQAAVNTAGDRCIRLRKDTTENITVFGNTYLDLNGCSITGKVTVAAGKILYCMDSATDDYSVADGKYGKLANVTGAVKAISEESEYAVDGYLMVEEENTLSFHRVNLQLTTLSLRPQSVGMYYKCSFACDEVAAQKVKKFGVALSVTQVPTVDNFESHCWLSELSGFRAGGVNTNVTSTLLKGIMKPGHVDAINASNADVPVYGRAYILLEDGTYMLGTPASRTFRQQVEEIDTMWDELSDSQCYYLAEMYRTYRNVMISWNVPNIALQAT